MRFTLIVGIASALLAVGPALAGSVAVSLDHPENFSDARDNLRTREDVGHAIGEHLKALGQRYLPAEQALEVTLLDVDLAGEMKPQLRIGQDIRVLRGRADWPRVSLRYTLRSGDKVVAQRDEVVSDMNYMTHQYSATNRDDALYFEKRMLTEWFRDRFAPDRH